MSIMVDPTALRGNIPQTDDTLVVQDWEDYKNSRSGCEQRSQRGYDQEKAAL